MPLWYRYLLLSLFLSSIIFGHFYETSLRFQSTWIRLSLEAAEFASSGGLLFTSGGLVEP